MLKCFLLHSSSWWQFSIHVAHEGIGCTAGWNNSPEIGCFEMNKYSFQFMFSAHEFPNCVSMLKIMSGVFFNGVSIRVIEAFFSCIETISETCSILL